MKYSMLSILAVLLFLFSSCTEEFYSHTIDINVDEYPQGLAMTSVWTNDEFEHKVLITEANPYLGEESKIIKNAKIEIKHKDESFTVIPEVDGHYYCFGNGPLIANDTYNIKINVDGFKTLEATQIFPDTVPILKLKYKAQSKTNPEGYREDEVQVTIIDPQKKGNYYAVRLKSEYNLLEQTLYTFSDDPYYDKSFGDVAIYSDRYKNGGELTFNLFGFGTLFQTDAIIAEVYTLSEEYYKYIISVKEDYDSTNPFAEPTIVQQNIKNGYGIFGMANKNTFRLEF